MPSEKAQEKRVWTIWVCPQCRRSTMDWKQGIDCDCGSDWEEIAVVPESALREAEAREAKLRKTLERIEERATHPPPGPSTNWTRIEWVAEMARAALTDQRKSRVRPILRRGSREETADFLAGYRDASEEA